MPGDLTSAYLGELRRSLPRGITDEIADGLATAREQHLARGLGAAAAEHAAVAEFGDARLLAAEFIRHAAGRRTARVMLATGPAVGVCWAAALIAGHAWTWPVPAVIRLSLGSALLLVVGFLAAAATSRRSYRRTLFAAPGGVAIVVLDVTMILGSVGTAPAASWTLAVAVAASLARAGLAARMVSRVHVRQP